MAKKRYKVVNEDGVQFWVLDTQSDRRLRPTNGLDAYYDEGLAQAEADRLNRRVKNDA